MNLPGDYWIVTSGRWTLKQLETVAAAHHRLIHMAYGPASVGKTLPVPWDEESLSHREVHVIQIQNAVEAIDRVFRIGVQT
jgi:phosphate starvation-inducible protein PhoH